MKGLKSIITGIGLIISGTIGVSMGNLEETLFYSSKLADTSVYKHSPMYYLFMIYLIIGFIYLIRGFMKKNQ
jgi:Na+/H+ antiporter NhaC